MFFPITTGCLLLVGPALPRESLTVRVAPDRPHLPLDDNLPDQPHFPHGDDPVDGSTSVVIAASGNLTNTSAQTVTGEMTRWELSTSASTYLQDLDLADVFKRAGLTLSLRLDDGSPEVSAKATPPDKSFPTLRHPEGGNQT